MNKMENKEIIECVMCRNEAAYIDERTDEPLCNSCTQINEGIYQRRGDTGNYKEVKNV